MSPFRAAFAGALLTFAILVGIIFPAIVFFTLTGTFDRDPNCDGFCFDRGGGFLFATFIMLYVAIPTSLVGGVVSFFAALVTPRRSRAA